MDCGPDECGHSSSPKIISAGHHCTRTAASTQAKRVAAPGLSYTHEAESVLRPSNWRTATNPADAGHCIYLPTICTIVDEDKIDWIVALRRWRARRRRGRSYRRCTCHCQTHLG